MTADSIGCRTVSRKKPGEVVDWTPAGKPTLWRYRRKRYLGFHSVAAAAAAAGTVGQCCPFLKGIREKTDK